MCSGLTVPDPALIPAHRRAVFQGLLWFWGIFGTVFAAINYANGRYDFTVLELLLACLSFALILVARRTPRLQAWILLYLALVFSIAIYVLATTAEAPTVFVWSLIFPLLSHLLLGRWLGGALAAIMMSLAGVIFFVKFGTHGEFSNPRAIGNVALSAVCVFGISHIYEVSRERAETQLRHMATTDPLTGLANRGKLDDIFQRELARFKRHGTPMAVLMIDLDHFKSVNDRHGHDAGDAVLRQVAQLLRERVRPSDLACRLGGEEFCVLLSDSTRDSACEVAEDLRRLTERMACVHADATIALSMSIGVAELGADGEDLPALISIADARLYAAKERGRNRVVG